MLTSELAKELSITIKDLKNAARDLAINLKDGNQELSKSELEKIRDYFKMKNNPQQKNERMIIVKKSAVESEDSSESKKVKPVKKVMIKIKKVIHKAEDKTEGDKKESPTQSIKIKHPVGVDNKEKPKDPNDKIIVKKDDKKDAKEDDGKEFRGKHKRTFKHEKTQPKEKEIQYRKKKELQKVSSIPKSIDIMETISVSELAKKMNVKASGIIAKLMELGMMATINQIIDAETAQIVAGEYGCEVHIVSLFDETVIEEPEDKKEDLLPRPPIVTIMGHVDHGKTTLLDYIRHSTVAAGESGGITQHIGAYKVSTRLGEIVFLDTPGHEAFTAMRYRGANVTDIVILVVAADEGVRPQTIEALNHAKAAEVPIIVAVNKMDSPEANPDRIKQQLSDHGLIPEDWGGETQYVNVSAKTGEGIDGLLETIVLTSEMLELKANPHRRAIGAIVESRIDQGRGPVATVLIQNGTISVGDHFIAGIFSGKVRALFDWEGKSVQTVGPATPVEVLGIDGVPEAGDPFHVLVSEREAKSVSEKRHELNRFEQAKNVKKITLDNLYEAILDGNIAELRIVIKADVQGSVEAIKDSLEKLSNQEVKVKVILSGTGAINESDVMLAAASDAIIMGFHVRPNSRALALAEKEGVDVRKYNIIYEVIDEVKSAMEGLLKPIIKEETLGMAEVRKTFKVSKIGTIAGCMIISGKFARNANVRIIRDGVIVYDGKITTLKRFKEDVKEVATGYECGVMLENYNDLKEGDELEAYREVKIAKKLQDAKSSTEK